MKLLSHSKSFPLLSPIGYWSLHAGVEHDLLWQEPRWPRTHKFAFFYSLPKPGIEIGLWSNDRLQGFLLAADSSSAVEMQQILSAYNHSNVKMFPSRHTVEIIFSFIIHFNIVLHIDMFIDIKVPRKTFRRVFFMSTLYV